MAAFAPALGQSLRSRPPRNPNNQSSGSPRQLEFSSAMKDFKNMFPDLDDEVIEAVLRANNGLVDATIDQLLSMGAGGDETKKTEGFPHLPSYSDTGPREPPPAYSPREEGPESNDFEPRPLPPRPYSNWNPPLLGNLPDDFLRLKPVSSSSRSTTRTDSSPNTTTFTERRSDREYEQFLEDEKLAKFLQNEEFVRELKHDRDFMMSLERDKQRSMALNTHKSTDEPPPPLASASSDKPSFDSEVHSSSLGGSSDPADLSHLGAAGGGHANSNSNQQNEDVVLREKLKHMGKSTRKKLDKMARLFQRKKTSQRANLITGGSASTVNLLEEYEDDDDDDLLNHIASGHLEIMNEGETENSGNRAESEDSPQAQDNPNQVKRYDPIEFYAEDNEFPFKPEN